MSTMLKCLFIMLLSANVSALDLSIDATLGSIVGENHTGSGANLPFNATLELTQDVGFGVSIGGVAGHQSTADYNGDEYSGEYYGLTARFDYRNFYTRSRVFKFYDNDDEAEGDTSFYVEAGITDKFRGVPIRLGLWFQEAEFYQAQGVNLGYTFDLF